jgi:protoporphyrinogen oxidase
MKVSYRIPAIVIGGGIAGLTAARTLQLLRRDFILLERCPTMGGLTRTVEVGEFCFDYTGHFLHLQRYPTPADIPFASLKNDDWNHVARRSCCLVEGNLVSAPIQYNLGELPTALLAECIESYEKRVQSKHVVDGSFRDYIINGFGEKLADIFLIPQNEKTMVIPLDRLSDRAVKRFFPAPDEKLVREGMRARKDQALGYNAGFWYPKAGGMGALVDGLRDGLENCTVSREVAAIDLEKKALATATGETYHWETIFSSMPLKALCEITNDGDLKAAASCLSHSSTISFNIGIKDTLPREFEDIHWVYVPNRDIPFYRVGFYSNISRGTCAPGYNAVYVEVGVTPDEADRVDLVNELQPKVMRSLEQLGWIAGEDVVCLVTHKIRCAYVHHTPSRDSAVSHILERLRINGVYPIGRYGLWDYTSMEDSIESARSTILEVA